MANLLDKTALPSPLRSGDKFYVVRGGTTDYVGDYDDFPGAVSASVGYIFDSTTLTDYDQSGSATWTQSGDDINVTGNSTIYSEECITYDYQHAHHNLRVRMLFTINVIDGTSYNIGVIFKSSVSNFLASLGIALATSTAGGGANKGKIQLWNLRTDSLITTGSQQLTIAQGDSVSIDVERVGNVYKVTWANVTDNTYCYEEFTLGFDASPNYLPNTGKIGLVVGGSTSDFDIHEFSAEITENANNDFVFIGDSITLGVYPYNYDLSFANQVFKGYDNVKYAINAGGGDDTSSFVNGIDATKNLLKSGGVAIVMIGGNDIGYGVSQATWESQYTTAVNSLKNDGYTVVHCLPTKRTGTDVTDLKDFINADFSSDVIIDTFSLFDGGSVTTPDTKYYFDTAHPNTIGHAIIAKTIRDGLVSNGLL